MDTVFLNIDFNIALGDSNIYLYELKKQSNLEMRLDRAKDSIIYKNDKFVIVYGKKLFLEEDAIFDSAVRLEDILILSINKPGHNEIKILGLNDIAQEYHKDHMIKLISKVIKLAEDKDYPLALSVLGDMISNIKKGWCSKEYLREFNNESLFRLKVHDTVYKIYDIDTEDAVDASYNVRILSLLYSYIFILDRV
jgi:hypothetical protein|uniref:Uncharacterized protein n=1 Tax=Myoviridae sp. ctYA416 TaxID=2825125 RepID=A0A8S5UTI3_9CAUD|nr:MAG TPA: hypothetical protein [Myoviridae sp. ctYA416]